MSASNIGLIIPLADAHRSRKTGAKAADLSRLIAARFDVPRGFVISSDAYRAHLWAAGVREVAAAAREAEDREQVRTAILSTPVPDDIRLAVEKARDQLALQLGERDPKLAVRPCPENTGAGSDMPGAYESYLNVTGMDGLLTAIKRVWSSVWCGKAAAYRARFGVTAEPAMAILVQHMVEPARCVTVCTADPVTGDPIRPTVTLATDGDSLRQTADLAGQADDVGHDAFLAVERSILVEDVLGGRVEVEWADDGRCCWVLQARLLADIPAFFPDADAANPGKNDKWRLAAPAPVSHFARSLLARRSGSAEPAAPPIRVVNGYVYRRLFTEAEAKRLTSPSAAERSLHKWRIDIAPALRESAGRSLSSDASTLLGGQLRSDIADAADMVRKSIEWLDLARAVASKLTADLRSSVPDAALLHRLVGGALTPLVLRDAELQELADRFAEAEASDKLSDAAWWPAYKADVAAFARTYGFAFRQEVEILDIASWRSWVEDTDPVFRLIAAMARRDGRPSLAACHAASLDIAAEAAREIDKPRSAGSAALKRTLALSRDWMAAAADCQLVCALTASALRGLVADAGRRLCDSGVLGEPGDIFHLTLDEILDSLDLPSVTHETATRRTVAARKHEIWLNSRLRPPSVLPSVPQEDSRTEAPKDTAALTGIPAGSGVAAGCARTPVMGTDVSEFGCGDILVLTDAAHAWTPLLAVAGGTICADGDDLCCAAVLARDYGIPAIVGCHGAACRIRDGQKVTLDAATGRVELHGPAALRVSAQAAQTR